VSLRALAQRYGINPKIIARWKKYISVAVRSHALLSLDDCLYALQPTIRR
jgi:hypothetical protein